MKKTILLSALLIISLVAKSQFNITGTVQDQPFTQYLTGARVTLFNVDTTFFRESRADVSGNYSFTNIPANTYSLGVSYLNKEYQQLTINIYTDSTFNFRLAPETQQGQWDIIVQSPEALGGTDLEYCNLMEIYFIVTAPKTLLFSIPKPTTPCPYKATPPY